MSSGRCALDLLNSYGGDSSDDDVPSCKVSTKRSVKDADCYASSKRLQTKFPLPALIVKPIKCEENLTGDLFFHEGRIRSFPHERGNWATYVYIPYETTLGMEELTNGVINNFGELDVKRMDHLHISLTKTVILRHHWIDSFIQSIRSLIANIKRFIIMFDVLNVYCNEERTRTFIGVQIRSGYDTLEKIVKGLDACLEEFRLPAFYKNPSFHMSIAWCLGDHEAKIKEELQLLNKQAQKIMSNHPEDNWYILVTHLQCKTGNKLFTFSCSS